MRLYAAGFFTNKKQEEMPAQNVLLSYGAKNARDRYNEYSEEQMRLFKAGAFSGKGQNEMLFSTGPQNVLFSFAHSSSRETCEKVLTEEGHEKMKLFLAGDWSPELHKEVCDAAGEKNLLCTNAAKASRARAEFFTANDQSYRVLVDSGAFTAWKQGTPIVLDDYIHYAMELRQKAINPANLEFIGLDIIAGTFEERKAGKLPTDAEVHEACKEGFRNFEVMRDVGVLCIPTFHRDDPIEYLEQMADAVMETESRRMCLAPRVDGSPTSVKMKWLNDCFQFLIKRYGPRVWENFKIHGLGISSIRMMETYPFYSVDSTGWLWAATNTTFKRFDGVRMLTLQKTANGLPNNWGKSVEGFRTPTLHTMQCVDKYRSQKDGSESGIVGGYWFGAAAIVADVRLESYITRHWKSLGVEFND